MNSLRKIQSVIIRLGNRYYKKLGIIGVPFEKGQVLLSLSLYIYIYIYI